MFYISTGKILLYPTIKFWKFILGLWLLYYRTNQGYYNGAVDRVISYYIILFVRHGLLRSFQETSRNPYDRENRAVWWHHRKLPSKTKWCNCDFWGYYRLYLSLRLWTFMIWSIWSFLDVIWCNIWETILEI